MAQLSVLQDQYHDLTTSLSRKISSIRFCNNPIEKQSLCTDAENDIADAAAILKRMEVEMRSLPYEKKHDAQARVKMLKNALEDQKRDYKACSATPSISSGQSKAQRARNQRSRANEKAERRRLLQGKHEADEGEIALLRANQVLEHTVEVGADTSNTLSSQRQQLLDTKDALEETDDLLVRARGTLRRMARRAATNKLVTGVIVFVEAVAVGLIVYYKFIKKHH